MQIRISADQQTRAIQIAGLRYHFTPFVIFHDEWERFSSGITEWQEWYATCSQKSDLCVIDGLRSGPLHLCVKDSDEDGRGIRPDPDEGRYVFLVLEHIKNQTAVKQQQNHA